MNSKQFIISLASVLIVSNASAQGVQFGVETGINIARLSISPKSAFGADELSSKLGARFGGLLNIGLGKGFSIEPGVVYSRKGIGYSATIYGESIEVQMRYNYIEVPLYVKYNFKGLQFGAGPYIAFTSAASYKGISLDTTVVEKIQITNDPDPDVGGVRPMDAGMNIKAGYIFPMGLFLTTQYGLGFSNTSAGNGLTAKNSVFSFSVGYYFNYKLKNNKEKQQSK